MTDTRSTGSEGPQTEAGRRLDEVAGITTNTATPHWRYDFDDEAQMRAYDARSIGDSAGEEEGQP